MVADGDMPVEVLISSLPLFLFLSLLSTSLLSKANTASSSSSSSPISNGVTKLFSSSLPASAAAVAATVPTVAEALASARAGVRLLLLPCGVAALVFVCDACPTMLLARVIFLVGLTSNGLGLAAPVEVLAMPLLP